MLSALMFAWYQPQCHFSAENFISPDILTHIVGYTLVLDDVLACILLLCCGCCFRDVFIRNLSCFNEFILQSMPPKKRVAEKTLLKYN